MRLDDALLLVDPRQRPVPYARDVFGVEREALGKMIGLDGHLEAVGEKDEPAEEWPARGRRRCSPLRTSTVIFS